MREIDSLLRDLAPRLAELEPARLRCQKKSRIYLVVLLVPLALAILGAFAAGDQTRAYYVIGSVIWAGIGFVLYSIQVGALQNQYRSDYKSFVIPRLLGLIDPGLRHEATGGIGEAEFLSTELFTTNPDRYSSEDLIEGKHGKTFLRLAEIDAEERRTSTDSKGNTRTTYVTIFQGLLLIADFNKHFQGRTFVFPDLAENLLGNFGRFFQKLGGRSETGLLRLEDPDFEKAFAVYSTDEIEARYLLSTAMMRRLLALRERFGKELRVAFKDSTVALAVPHRAPYLEPRLGTASTDTDQVRSLLVDLDQFLGMIDELDLNTRIWTKD